MNLGKIASNSFKIEEHDYFFLPKSKKSKFTNLMQYALCLSYEKTNIERTRSIYDIKGLARLFIIALCLKRDAPSHYPTRKVFRFLLKYLNLV